MFIFSRNLAKFAKNVTISKDFGLVSVLFPSAIPDGFMDLTCFWSRVTFFTAMRFAIVLASSARKFEQKSSLGDSAFSNFLARLLKCFWQPSFLLPSLRARSSFSANEKYTCHFRKLSPFFRQRMANGIEWKLRRAKGTSDMQTQKSSRISIRNPCLPRDQNIHV